MTPCIAAGHEDLQDLAGHILLSSLLHAHTENSSMLKGITLEVSGSELNLQVDRY